jgi:uncharacterized protein YjbI with pentapeptide repeats
MPMPEDVRITIGLAVLAALLLAIAVWWLWWRLPKREVARLALKVRDPKARADIEDNYRKTVGQALGGIAVLLGAGLAYLQFSQQQRTAHDLLISGQVSKGFELLGNKDKDAVVLRLGGIYALEGVMNNSDQYHQPVLEALSAFVRESTKADTSSALPTDIQAALTVIGRRSAGQGAVSLTRANIAGANLFRAPLNHADLSSANLTFAYLREADLSSTNLSDANLSRANLRGADLTGAELQGTNLSDAGLSGASLRGAKLNYANLTRADLTSANLTRADLTSANLSSANLTGANLTGAQIDQKRLDEACGSDAVLPTGLTLKPCMPPP